MPVKNEVHIHTYERPRHNKSIYRCIAPDCTHYAKKEFVLGKYALCPECGSQFIMTREKLLRAKPRCDFCSNTKKSQQLRQIGANEALKDIFESMTTPVGEEEGKL